MQVRQLLERLSVLAALAAATTVAMGACGSDDGPPRGTGVAPSVDTGTTGSGGGPAGCDDGERRECKVQLDANNCFVGEHECVEGEWGPCVEPESLDSLAIGPITDCPLNPCNPWCQQFGDETPGAPITASGTPGPAGGTINGLPSNWQSAGQVEPCANPGDCQFDTYCDINMASPTYQQCVPWAYNGFDSANNTAPDFTVPVQCDSSYVTICNRSNYTVPAGTDVEVVTFSANTSNFGTCNDFSGSAHTTCVWSGGMGPGQCVNVTGCSLSGTTNIYVNPPDPPGSSPPGAIAESSSVPGNACENNWSVYHPATQCSCTNVSTTGSLSQVNIYLLLDNSGSMGGPAQSCNCGCTNSWDSAVAALSNFVALPSADPLRLAFSVYDVPNNACDAPGGGGSCDPVACEAALYPVDFLSNAAHQNNIINWLQDSANDATCGQTWTPHSAALQGGATVVSNWNSTTFPGEKNVLVYISDGAGDSCGQSNAQVAAKVSGIEAYTIALPGSSITLLNAIAAQGGTGSAIDLRSYSGATLNAQLEAALVSIQQATASCVLTIPNAGQVDFANLTVSWTPTAGMPVTMAQVANLGACNPMPAAGVMEYFVTPAMSPTDVELCPAACALVQADVTSTIQLLGECIGGYTQNIHGPIPYEADCSAIGTGQPHWDFLYYDTTQTGDSTIEFQIRTGNDAAEASMGAWTTVAVANLANPDALGGNPIDLAAALGPLIQQKNLELRFLINPTSNGAGTPQLIDWSLQYSCLDSI